jgi:hypothetical protein
VPTPEKLDEAIPPVPVTEQSSPDQPQAEQPAPMHDIHPPHHAATTSRDFLIHIATIVLGLLIALGLEQSVERIHHYYELSETREALAQEELANEKAWADNEFDWRRTFVELKNNLAVLEYVRAHPGTPQTALPGDLKWTQSPFMWNHAVWDSAQQKGITQRMPLEEANSHTEFYGFMTMMAGQSLQTWNAINEAHRFDLLDPDPTHLSSQQLDEVINLVLIALQRHITFGYSFGLVAHEYPHRPHTITWDLIETLRPTAVGLDPKGMAIPHEMTQARLKEANSGPAGNVIARRR